MGQLNFKSNAAQSPTALGSLQSANAYGQAIPVGYGQTQSPLLPIWAANLRIGGNGKTKFKDFKKGITNYCENIDYLLGHNPIMGVLQVMVNGGNYPLNFTSESFTAAAGRGSYTVTDSNFYFVIAVTLEAEYSFAVNDYGGQGAETLTGTYEIPLWNETETGPDPTAPASYRNWPYCYRWAPGSGDTVTIDAEAFPGGTLKIYYAQLMDATSFEVPIAKLALSFEQQLGSGDEYASAPAPFNAQQIIYPMFAGLGSSEIDLGATGALPQLLPEIRFKWGVYPTGDADFVDIIEDIYKSGLAQANAEQYPPYTQQERGLSSYDLPGTVQKKIDRHSSVSLPPMTYDMQNMAGNFLIAAVTATGTLAISSSAGDHWAKIYADDSGWQVWYAVAEGGPNTVTVTGASAPWQMQIMEIFGVGLNVPVPPIPPTPGGQITAIAATVTPNTITGANCVGDVIAYDLTSSDQSLVGTPGDFGTGEAQVAWTSFQVPAGLPTDAVISAVQFYFEFNFVNTGGGIGTDTTLWAPGVWEVAGIPAAGTYIGSDIKSGTTYGDLVTLFSGSLHFTLELANTGPIDSAQAFTMAATIENLGIVISYTSASDPVSSGILDEIAVVTSSLTGSIDCSVEQGYPAYLLAIALYGSAEAPAALPNAEWDPVTPANFYGEATTSMQMHERIVRSPGTYSITEQGPTPGSLLLFSFKATEAPNYPRPLGDFIDVPSFDLVRQQCRAYGLWGSLSMNSQADGSKWIETLCQSANCAPVYLGSKFFLYPYAEPSTAGNGCEYTSPTAMGPIASLSDLNGDFVDSGMPVEDTAKRIDLPNVLQIQCIDRNTNYNQVTVSQPESASIALYGERKADPVVNNSIQDPTVARSVLAVMVKRLQLGGDVHNFTISARWGLLSPMDLITITDTEQGLGPTDVRLISLEEQSDGSFACKAEPFVYGMCAPIPLSTGSPVVNPTSILTTAGDVNPPIIFEPVPGLYPAATGGVAPAELWVVASSGAANYGGAQVFVSVDGGASYVPAPGIGTVTTNVITGNSATGDLVTDWPAAADPDSTNNLEVDLTESNGALLSYSTAQENTFGFPCYVSGGAFTVEMNGTAVAGGTDVTVEMNGTAVAEIGTEEMNGTAVASSTSSGIPYELMTYAVATMTAASKYTLEATGSGNFLRRAVFDAPAVGAGSDHPAGSRFAFLNPTGAGILKMVLPAQYVGVEIFFKICSFNQFGSALQSQSDVAAYSYTPTGIPGGL